jgi:hypothetical protein
LRSEPANSMTRSQLKKNKFLLAVMRPPIFSAAKRACNCITFPTSVLVRADEVIE